jgi:hypothetical protein
VSSKLGSRIKLETWARADIHFVKCNIALIIKNL